MLCKAIWNKIFTCPTYLLLGSEPQLSGTCGCFKFSQKLTSANISTFTVCSNCIYTSCSSYGICIFTSLRVLSLNLCLNTFQPFQTQSAVQASSVVPGAPVHPAFPHFPLTMLPSTTSPLTTSVQTPLTVPVISLPSSSASPAAGTVVPPAGLIANPGNYFPFFASYMPTAAMLAASSLYPQLGSSQTDQSQARGPSNTPVTK